MSPCGSGSQQPPWNSCCCTEHPRAGVKLKREGWQQISQLQDVLSFEIRHKPPKASSTHLMWHLPLGKSHLEIFIPWLVKAAINNPSVLQGCLVMFLYLWEVCFVLEQGVFLNSIIPKVPLCGLQYLTDNVGWNTDQDIN